MTTHLPLSLSLSLSLSLCSVSQICAHPVFSTVYLVSHSILLCSVLFFSFSLSRCFSLLPPHLSLSLPTSPPRAPPCVPISKHTQNSVFVSQTAPSPPHTHTHTHTALL